MRNYIANFAIFFSGWFIDMLISIITPKLISTFIDEIVYYENSGTFLKIGLVIFFTIIFWCILYIFIYAQHQYLMSKFTFDIKRDIFRQIHRCDSQLLQEIPNGELLTLLQTYSNECMFFIIRNILHFFNGIIKLVIISVILMGIDFKIGIFIFSVAVLNVLVGTLFGKKSRQYGEKQRNCYNKYIAWLIEVLTASKDIRVLNAFRKVEKDFCDRHEEIFHVGYSSGINTLNAENVVQGLTLAVRLIIFIMCGLLAIDGKITLGNFMFILSLSAILIEQVKWTSASIVDSQWRVAYIDQIARFLSYDTEKQWQGTEELNVKDGNIEIQDMTFSYKNGHTVFENLSISIIGGKKNAVVGENGCGKSTIASILTGFLAPEKGNVKIDGMNLKECSLKSIRKNIGIVTQEIFVFGGTIKENILLGYPQATDNEVMDACRKAGLLDYIQSLPEGWNTYIETGGTNISGGQKQRIAIARVYLKNPPIIIFDEATASLDRATEDEVIETWKNVLKDRTSIIITHKENILKICDYVTFLTDKKVKEVTLSQSIVATDTNISV